MAEDWIKHVRHTHAEKPHEAWCGERIWSSDWVFQDIDHAAYTLMQNRYLVPCPDCIRKIVEALTGTISEKK